MKSLGILAVALLASASSAFAGDSDHVLLQLRVDKREVEVLPQGEPSRVFLVDPNLAHLEGDRWSMGERFAASGDSLTVDGRSYGLDELGEMDVERDGDRLVITLLVRSKPVHRSPRPTNRTATARDMRVAADDFVRGYVLSFGGDVEVEGEVNRSVVALGGDVIVDSGGVVRGSVVAVGGNVHKADLATVYGDLYAGNRRRFRPRWFERNQENRLNLDVALDYTRVTGALPWVRLSLRPDAKDAPSLMAAAGYAFESELWHYKVGVGRAEPRGFQFDLSGYRDTKHDDQLRIGKNENLIFALLFRTDYRDYYFAEGFRAAAGWGFGRDRNVTIGYQNELIHPLAAHPRLFSLFGGDPFGANYETLTRAGDARLATDFEGRRAYLSADAHYRYPYFEEPASGVWMLQASAEASDPDLASDFKYSRYYGSVTRSQSLWPDHSMRVRVAAGGSGGRLAATRLYYLGGIGSLRGYDYKEFAGDRFWLANLEYTWALKNFEIFSLFDGGQIGSGPGWTDSDLRFDLGLGLSIEETFRVQVAWAPAEDNHKPLVTVRFSSPF
jgi:hypothetical protein